MAAWAWSGRRWSSKQYILTALLGTLVAIAAAAAISISLAPGHVSFTIADAEMSSVTVDEEEQLYNDYYNFTLVAINTSKRMAVRYGSLSANIWYRENSWIPAEDVNTTAEMPGWSQPLGEPAVVRVWADWAQYNVKANETVSSQMATNNKNNDTDKRNINWPNCLVSLEAKVWFRFGLIPTMPFTVRASCFPVNFRDGLINNSSVQCTS
ncbi:hypothetical protein QOZ80_5BG0451420 [Eleusine coracana subsp. coracana]|nr:hypothetical protein QOZ80_5BG0451420 [Eleusine coracana subsp. coracana]